MQWFETSWKTMQQRTRRVYGGLRGDLDPASGGALYDDQGGGIGYNLYDRFDMGKAGDPTLYGTENQYRALIQGIRGHGLVYVDYVHHHVGAWDVPTRTAGSLRGEVLAEGQGPQRLSRALS